MCCVGQVNRRCDKIEAAQLCSFDACAYFLLVLFSARVISIVKIGIAQKTSHLHRKEGSSVRPKGSMLEKAIRELERMVAECKKYSFDFPSYFLSK